ncbi:probable cytochrome P450 4d14 [Sabethes cyaneus]|uniref:probable cytochrome P450 4d14 n=1 Tax=Sabethes cyaneus TaxID=53552 RepID=UPI00237D52E1|nr:probable cytochrome P450 4d14 [Sabethes cyaneus]
MFFQAIIVGTVLFLVIQYIREHRKLKVIAAHFGGPKPLPLVGNLLEFNTDVPGIFEVGIRLLKAHGPDTFFWGLFNLYILVVSSPKNVEKVLLAKNAQKSLLYTFLESWLGTGLLLSSGEKWFQRRRIITPAFHFKILEQFVAVFNKETDVMVANLRKHVDGKEFDIYSYVTLMALDSICETSMGTTVNAQNDPDNDYVRNVKNMSVLFLTRIFDPLAGYPVLYELIHPRAYKQRKIVRELHKFTDSVIAERRKQLSQDKGGKVSSSNQNDENIYSKQRMTFLDLLMNIDVDGEPLDDIEIREEVDTFMFEGHDTTTSGISFSIYELARNPHVQDRIYDEIVSVLGKDHREATLTYQKLQEFRYLEMVIKEALRLYPPVPFIGRHLMEDTELDGITLPAGVEVLISIYMIHRNPDIFPDPDRFDPERFSDSAESKWGPYDYIPFSAGARNCIGQRFAMLELKVTLIKLISNYRILPGESLRKLRVKTDLVIRPHMGVPVKLVKRE